MLPYSREVYFSLFGELNTRFLFMQIGALVLALCLVYWLLRPQGTQRRTLFILLSALWAGSSYFWFYRVFGAINFLASVYAAFAAAQAFGFAIAAALSGSCKCPSKINRIATASLISLAVFWPAIDLASGSSWPMVRMIGLHPVPLLLLTCATLVPLRQALALALGGIPLLLSGVCAYEAYVLDLKQDWLPLCATLCTGMLIIRTGVQQGVKN